MKIKTNKFVKFGNAGVGVCPGAAGFHISFIYKEKI
jgi:hypothetical protein